MTNGLIKLAQEDPSFHFRCAQSAVDLLMFQRSAHVSEQLQEMPASRCRHWLGGRAALSLPVSSFRLLCRLCCTGAWCCLLLTSPPSLLLSSAPRLPACSREEETNQTVIEGMGELHLEIIVDRLRREWKVECDVGAPQVGAGLPASHTAVLCFALLLGAAGARSWGALRRCCVLACCAPAPGHVSKSAAGRSSQSLHPAAPLTLLLPSLLSSLPPCPPCLPASPVQVNYREGISRAAEVRYVHKKQSGGSGQFADIAVKFEPGEAGTGFEFRSEIKGGVVPKEYIPGVTKVNAGADLAALTWR